MKKAIYGMSMVLGLFFLSQTLQDRQGRIAYAAEPPQDPILCIETGMHTARADWIGIDAENRFLVTGSLDKTVRIWELATGRLLNTIRPPIGEQDKGHITAVAISPDGRSIACGGRASIEKSYSIYIFDRESGKLIKRIAGLPNSILQLAYCKEGKFLLATSGGKNSLKIYEAPAYTLGKTKGFAEFSARADFDKQGRLVTVSYDGPIRLYDKNFTRTAEAKPKGGNHPRTVSFSPDGSQIAVGYSDSIKVDIFSGRDLAYLYSADTSRIESGFFITLAWSVDGRFLYGGKALPPTFIRKWASGKGGSYKDISTASYYSFLHLLPLNKGGVVFCSADPTFGVIDSQDKIGLLKESYRIDYRDNSESLLISDDGSQIGFIYEPRAQNPARFSVPDRSLTVGLRALFAKSLNRPITSGRGLDIKKWQYTPSPELQGLPLKLLPGERSTSLAISPDGNSFALGADWSFRLFDRKGQEKWKIFPGMATPSINFSGNGKIVLVALADGTIRWHRADNGKELLAFFPHKDRKRWVLWTPSGYFDASPGAEEFIGWHVNHGQNQAADFFPASKFRSAYYRPDVIAKILVTLDEKESIRLANAESGRKQEASIQQMLPPIVHIIFPRDGAEVSSTEVNVSFSVRTPSGEPVIGIKALVNGRPMASERAVRIVPQEGDVRQIKVSIPEGESQISIVAENRFSASEPATVRVKWKGQALKEEFVIKPKLYVLAIGVSKYEDKNLTLSFASKDASDFCETIQKQKGELYRDVVIRLLADQKATKDEILDGLDWIQKETTSKDVAVIFLAGHGVNDPGGLYYFLPVNVQTERLKRTGMAFSDVKNTVASLAGKTVVFLDTCHAGNIMGKRRGALDLTGVVNELTSAESGAVVFASSTGNQYSVEDPAWKNGAFTKALVEGIGGKADYTGKGRITINMLDLYISERVKELTKGRQTPTTTKPQTISDFPIAVSGR